MPKLRGWPTDAVDVSGSERRGRVELGSCARACPRRKTELASGPGLAVAQSKRFMWISVHRRIGTGRLRLMGHSDCQKREEIWTVESRS